MVNTTAPEITLPLAGAQHSAEGIELAVLPPRGILTIRGNQNAPEFNDWFARHFGMRCPKVGQVVRKDGLDIYWQSPDQLLLCCDDHLGMQDWQVKLTINRPVTPWVSLIETSDYFCSFSLEGARGFDVLRQGSPYDFSSLIKGKAVFTNLHHANILVDYAEENRIIVMVRSSFAQYLWDHLVYASKQLGHFA